ncbi:hypothetical protein [Streptomyces acidicola]
MLERRRNGWFAERPHSHGASTDFGAGREFWLLNRQAVQPFADYAHPTK